MTSFQELISPGPDPSGARCAGSMPASLTLVRKYLGADSELNPKDVN
jgi:hypothetical protein